MSLTKEIRHILPSLLIILALSAGTLSAEKPSGSVRTSILGDSIEKQLLFNGKIWTNIYHMTEGHQFFSSRDFLPGSVSMNSKVFSGPSLRLKLDLVNDELLLSADKSTVLQLNKEMVDFFNLEAEGRTFHFVRLGGDSINSLSGYFNLLYSGSAGLYVSYKKELRLRSSVGERDTFIQMQSVFLVRDGIAHRITGRASLMKLLADRKIQVRRFIRSEKLRITKNNPGNMVPVMEYYDGIE